LPSVRTRDGFQESWESTAPQFARLGRVYFDDARLQPPLDVAKLLERIRSRVAERWEPTNANGPARLKKLVAGEMLGHALEIYASSLRGMIAGQVWSEELIEELVQAASVRAVERLHEITSRPRPLFGWLCQLVKQQRVDWLRIRSALKRDAGRTVPLSGAAEVIVVGTTPTQAERKLRVGEMFEKVLAALPEETATMLRWHANEHLGPTEMAQRLGISPGNARVRLCRARSESCAIWLSLFPETAADFQEFGIFDSVQPEQP